MKCIYVFWLVKQLCEFKLLVSGYRGFTQLRKKDSAQLPSEGKSDSRVTNAKPLLFLEAISIFLIAPSDRNSFLAIFIRCGSGLFTRPLCLIAELCLPLGLLLGDNDSFNVKCLQIELRNLDLF